MRKFILSLCFCFIFSFVHAKQISTDIKELLSSEGKVVFGNEPNSIVVIDYPENIQRVAEYLEAIDVSPRQVLIEARVVEVKLQKEHALGVNWTLFADKGGFAMGQFKVGSSAGGALEQAIPYKTTYYPPAQTTTGAESPFTVNIFDENINVVLKALANNLDTNILSAPRVTTVNNREALIKVIQSLPWAEPQVTIDDAGNVIVTWTIHFEEVGISLKVTPTINEDGRISMELNPEVSEWVRDYSLEVVQGSTRVPYTVPVIDKRTASTKVVIGNGQTLIIGGLIKDKTTKGQTKVPFFGDVPFLGYLFKSKKDVKDKTELLIFVSPKVITPEEYARMKKEERYGVGKEYIEEREKKTRMQEVLEFKAEAERDKLATQLDSLSARQKALAEERMKLETKISEEEIGLKELGKAKQAIVKKREELEK